MKRAPHAIVVGLFALSATLAIAGVPRDAVNPGPGLGVPPQAPIGVDPIRNDALQENFLKAFPGGGFVDLGPRIRRVWGTTFSHGRTPSESVSSFYRQWSGLWGVDASDLKAIGPFEDGAHTLPIMGIEGADGASAFTGVYFTQTVVGVPVFRAYGWGLVRNEQDFPMVLGGGTLRPVGDMADRMAGRDLNPANLEMGVYAGEALAEFDEPPVMTSPRYVVWAGIDDDVQEARLAVEFVAEAGAGQGDPDAYRKLQFVTDADTGEVLHRESLVRHAVNGTVTGLATDGFGADTCAAEVSKPLPHIEVKTGTTTVYADGSGNYSIPAGAAGATYTTRLVGRYFTTTNNSAATVSLSTTANDGATWSPVFNAANTSATERAQVNAYYMANLMRDLTISVAPSFPSVSTQTNAFQINCNIASSCNAYYVSSTINFYVSGGGCANTAFGDVVCHEYGHNIVEKGGSGQQAYGEGMGDVCGLLASDDPRTGVGFQSCTTGIRTASNTCQYSAGTACSSCGSEIHACGQLISGCVWDLRNLFLAKYPSNYRTRLASLAINEVPLHAGQSDIASDITVDYLTLNDTDGNISNGTPDYSEIAQAFGAHGLPAPALSLLDITFPSGRPSISSPAGTTPVTVQVSPLGATPSGTVKLYAKIGSASTFTAYPMTSIGGNQYRANLPVAACTSNLAWYVEALTTASVAVRSPSNAPTSSYASTAAYGVTTSFSDDVETVKGWTLGVTGDTATTGQWVRGDPVGTAAQPENARSGTNCFFTGQGSVGGTVGAADVDGGRTTLQSPAFDLSNAAAAVLSLYYWHSNDQGAQPNEDPLLIQASSNGTTWVQVDSINTNNNAWTLKEYRLDSFITLSSTVRIRVVSLDEGAGGSVVESAIDDVAVAAISCASPCPSDLDGNTVVDAGDIGVLLLAFGNCSGSCPSDLDGNGVVDAGDIGVLLLAFGNCP